MRHFAIPFLFSLALLSACERSGDAPDAPGDRPASETAAATDVVVADEIAPLPGAATGVAFWTHPTVPFNGLVIAATGAGLYAYTIEDGEEAARTETVAASGVDVFYAGAGNAARGFALTRDAGDQRFRLFEIDNSTRAFSEVSLETPPDPGVDGFCVGASEDDEPRLYALGGGAMRAYAMSIDDDSATLDAVGQAETPDGAAGCAVDDDDGSVFLVTDNGDLYRYRAASGFGAQFAATGFDAAGVIKVALNGLDAEEDECCGQIAVLERGAAVVHLFARKDGAPLGAVRLAASFDHEGVETATTFGLGYANYGAVYRDGVLALATGGAKPSLRLAPLNAVMDAVDAPLGRAASPRALLPQEEDNGLIIDIEPIKP